MYFSRMSIPGIQTLHKAFNEHERLSSCGIYFNKVVSEMYFIRGGGNMHLHLHGKKAQMWGDLKYEMSFYRQ